MERHDRRSLTLLTDGRRENQESGRHTTQQDGKKNSGRRPEFANLADRLADLAVTREHRRQSGDADEKNGSG